MKTTLHFLSTIFILLLLYGKAQSQTSGTADASLNIGTAGFNSSVQTITIQSDGKILAGGNFTSYKFLEQNRIVRLDASGNLDATFEIETGFDGTVSSIVTQPDGKILVAGQFTKYKGLNQNYIARLNTDGSIDATFDIGTGFDSYINKIVLQPDGKILVAGNFTSYKGTTQKRIARLNTDGTIDNTFESGTGFNSDVLTITLQTDGKILAGGQFTTYKDLTQRYIARLNTDGTIDSSLDIGSSFNNYVNRIAAQSNGKILVTGQFSNYKGTTQARIARLNTNGSIDTSFDTGTGFDALVNTIVVQPDDKILVGGNFYNYKGISKNRIVRLNTDGSLDTSLETGTGFDGNVQTLALQADGKILAGGSFVNYNNASQAGIVRLHNKFTYTINTSSSPTGRGTTTGEGTYDGAATATVTATANTNYIFVNWTEEETEVSTEQTYSFAVNKHRNLVANFKNEKANGTADASLNVGALGFSATVRTIAIQTDGKILAGGNFTNYKFVDRNRIARLDENGDLDNTFSIGTGFDGTVTSIITQSDGKILVAGQFITYKDLTQKYIARLNTDGTIDATFDIGTGFDSYINKIALQTDGKILVVGNFTSYNGTTQNRIARLNSDGSIDNTFSTGTGFNSDVLTITLQTDGKILAGGQFSTYKDLTQRHIARLNTDGTIDSSLDIGSSFNSYVNNVAIQTDGKILVTGNFTNYKGTSQNRIARLNTVGSLDTSFDIGTGFDGLVNTIVVQPDDKILMGGTFTKYNDLTQDRIVRLNTNGSLDTSFEIGTGFNGNVQTLILQVDGKILAGGGFTIFNGESKSNIARLHNSFVYHVNIVSNFVEVGTLTGNGTYDEGATATVTATANTGYSFAYWTDGGTTVSTTPTYSFTVNAHKNLTANFSVTTLPVTLIGFTAKINSNHAKLQWQTTNELNNKGFVIYRSGDESKFVKIGDVSSTSMRTDEQSSGSTYTFTDKAPLNGNNYYKLVQVDNDGKTTELGIRSLVFGVSGLDFQLYPNPATDKLNIVFGIGKFQNLRLLDITGKVLQKHTLTNTQNEIVLNVGNYPKGIYVVELSGNNRNHVVKISK